MKKRHRFEVIENRDGPPVESLRERIGIDCPGEIRNTRAPVDDRPSDVEAGGVDGDIGRGQERADETLQARVVGALKSGGVERMIGP